jgi:hypothetical protein
MGNEVSAPSIQAKPVPGSEKENWGPIYRAIEVHPDKPLVKSLYPEVCVMALEMFVERFCLGFVFFFLFSCFVFFSAFDGCGKM